MQVIYNFFTRIKQFNYELGKLTSGKTILDLFILNFNQGYLSEVI